MQALLILALVLTGSFAYSANLNCIIRQELDLDDIVGDDGEPLVIEARATLKTKASREAGKIVGEMKIRLGQEKAKYKCGGTETTTELDIYCIPQPAEDYGDESTLLVKLTQTAEAKQFVGTAYVNDGDNETTPNIFCTQK